MERYPGHGAHDAIRVVEIDEWLGVYWNLDAFVNPFLRQHNCLITVLFTPFHAPVGVVNEGGAFRATQFLTESNVGAVFGKGCAIDIHHGPIGQAQVI